MIQNEQEDATDLPPNPAGRDRALAALERMGKPQPKPAGGSADSPDPAQEALAAGSGSATGFVGTLARETLDAGGLLSPPAAEHADPPSRMNLPMAREILPAASAIPCVPIEMAPPIAPVPPPASRIVIALMLLFSLLLIAIGGWAAGALFYMARVTPFGPADVHYPLLSWTFDAGPAGDFTAATRAMAWTMLLCLPVAAVILAITAKIARRKS